MSVFDSFRAARWVRTVNLLLQAALFTSLFAGLNYLAQNWLVESARIDLTAYRRFSLFPETAAYLRGLTSPVRIVVTAAENAVSADLRGLLREYAFATAGNPDGRVTVEYLNVDLNRRAAQQLGLEQPDQVVLMCNGNRHILSESELYVSGPLQRRAFDGEARITSALLDVSNPERRKIYFLKGHQELQTENTDPNQGLSTARDLLRQRNFPVQSLDLVVARAIPADAAALIAVNPRTPYSPREEELLRQYLSSREGRLMLLLSPNAKLGLDRVLADWGVVADDDLIQDTGPNNLTEDGDLIIRSFSRHPVTAALLNASFQPRLRLGAARTVRPDPARASAGGLEVVTLASTSATAWGEVNASLRRSSAYAPGIDLPPAPGGWGVAVASSRAAARGNLPFSVRNGRLVLIGSGDLFANARISREGSLDFLLGAVNWMMDRDRELSIPARPLERFQLSLSARELQNLRYSLLFLVPGAAALLGVIVYWTRRS
jgi:ABC-type uncharacterized transport system involved in gliding motility auxiliary subunit